MLSIIVLAAGLRFYDLNWDQNQHLHPDERFLVMVDEGIHWPKDVAEYFSTSTSPLNPFINGFPFFVYGTFPLFFAKFLAGVFSSSGYDSSTIFGRGLSALFDTGTVVLIYLVARKSLTRSAALIAAFLYAVTVLSIQLAHFYTTDSFLVFFLMATIYFLIDLPYRPQTLATVFGAACFGLALSSKVSAILLIPALAAVFLLLFVHRRKQGILLTLTFALTSLVVFRVAQPYAFSGPSFFGLLPNPDFVNSLLQLEALSQPGSLYPPSVQWYTTAPLLYPAGNLLLWGLGLPLGVLSGFAILATIIQLVLRLPHSLLQIKSLNQSYFSIFFLTIFTLTVFFYQGVQFVKPMRYFLPMVPPLLIICATFLSVMHRQLVSRIYRHGSLSLQRYLDLFFYIFIFTLLIWPLAFMSIYTRPHTRVLASEWIYQNVPPGAKILTEYWDDGLPLTLDAQHVSSIYPSQQLSLFDQDTPEKWIKISQQLADSDYVIISSGRVYTQIPKLPNRYPVTELYYKLLFNGQLGFSKVAQVTSYPTFLGISADDHLADETFTVYDHPKVMIFKKTIALSQADILAALHQVNQPE